jgi:ketosteroid isomerase-like protein
MPEFDEASIRALAKHLFDSVEASDMDGFISCFAPEAQIWNNTDQKQVTPEEMSGILGRLDSLATDKRYEQRRLDVFPGGFVQRHMLCGTRKVDSQRIEMPACLVAEVVNGKIIRTYDYVDSAKAAEFEK